MQQRPQREMKFTQFLKIFPATFKTQSFTQELTMCPSPDTNDSSPQSSTLLLYDSCQYYPLIYTQGSWSNIVGIVTVLWAEWSKVQILEEARDFSLLKRCPEWPWGPCTPPIQWVLGASSMGVKWPACEADHSPLYSAEVKNEWSHASIPICLYGVSRDSFTFTIYILVLQMASSLQAFCPVFGTHFSSLSCICTWYRLWSHW